MDCTKTKIVDITLNRECIKPKCDIRLTKCTASNGAYPKN